MNQATIRSQNSINKFVDWEYNDGGRSDYFKGDAGDCVTRAIAIAFNLDYKEVYDELSERNKDVGGKKSARNGLKKSVYEKYITELGGKWKALMKIGSGCTTHVRKDELPETGSFILRLSRHLAAYKDGKLLDTYDCSRSGSRCVYGYWEVV